MRTLLAPKVGKRFVFVATYRGECDADIKANSSGLRAWRPPKVLVTHIECESETVADHVLISSQYATLFEGIDTGEQVCFSAKVSPYTRANGTKDYCLDGIKDLTKKETPAP